jgi:tripeptide aminopeptidase
MINKDRLADTFKFLVEIDSVSGEEKKISQEIQKIWDSLGAETFTDGAGEKTGGNAGNLFAVFSGNRAVEPMMLNAHMDTVEPGRGIRPRFENGVFTSSGDTILGADDKSAIAVLIEVMRVLKEDGLDHGPIEIVLTVAEEVGLKGAKNLDFSRIRSRFGYALDSSDTEGIVVRAPAANRIEFRIHGKDAHAGAAPEKGINAIMIAAQALAGLEIGRIDRETTCNIGVIEGGKAINIVPSLVVVKGEARSHDRAKLDRTTEAMVSAFETAVQNYRDRHREDCLENDEPRLEVIIENDFLSTHIPEDHRVVRLAAEAAANLGRAMRAKPTGGGADANVFFQKGIITGVLGTGMRDMHTVREYVELADMVRAAELVLEIIRLHAQG